MKKILIGGLLCFSLAGWFLMSEISFGARENTVGTASFNSTLGGQSEFQTYTFFASSTAQTNYATSTSATSTDIISWFDSNGKLIDGKFVIAGAKRVTMIFGRGDATGAANSGSTMFKVQATPDGENWYNFNRLNAATSTEDGGTDNNLLWQPFVEIAAGTTTVQAVLDLSHESIYAIRCVVIETTDGEHTCRASADW